MNLPALIASAAGAVSFFVGIWHLLVYHRGTRERTQLTFALACFAIGLFDICRIGNYLTYTVEASGFWQLGEQMTGALLSVPLVWFIVLTRRERLDWLAIGVSAYFSCVALLILLAPRSWLLNGLPRVTHVHLPWGMQLRYYEVDHGPVLARVSDISSLVILAVVAAVSRPLKGEAERNSRVAKLVRLGMVVFLLGALNDIAVSRRFYQFPYLMEVAYLGLILVVTWGMSNSVLELALTRAELRREHARLQRIFDQINEVYVETTLDGTIRAISPSVYRWSGWDFEARGRSILELYDDPERRKELVRQLKLHGKVTDFSVAIRVAQGDARDGEISATLVRDEETGELLVLGSIRDVTERNRAEAAKAALEQQLQRSQKLESLGVLAGGIAHDFNNLLAGILASTELAKLRIGKDHPAHEPLNVTLQSSQRAAELCRLMLAYSGKGRFVVEPIDLSELVRSLRELLAVSVNKEARLEFDLSNQKLIVNADATQLNQVLLNLVLNASEALGGNRGHVRVTTRLIECTAEQLRSDYLGAGCDAGSYVALEVSDDGCGMDEATRRLLFDPFFTTKFSGRGLGLAAVLGIVRAHRGTIHVESEVGKGSRFRVLLPAKDAPLLPSAAAPAQESNWVGQGAALVIDDEPTVCTMTGQMLEVLGYRVTTADDAEAGLAQYQQANGRFQLVVLDTTMPKLTGEQVLTQMRQINPLLPAVLMSGYSEEVVLSPNSRSGRTAFLQKPFTIEELHQQAHTVVTAPLE